MLILLSILNLLFFLLFMYQVTIFPLVCIDPVVHSAFTYIMINACSTCYDISHQINMYRSQSLCKYDIIHQTFSYSLGSKNHFHIRLYGRALIYSKQEVQGALSRRSGCWMFFQTLEILKEKNKY